MSHGQKHFLNPNINFEDVKDMVDHPPHYNSGKFEVIDILEDSLGDGFEPYCVGNILKYMLRYKNKNGLEDLKKARWYLNKLIETKETPE